MNIPKHFFVKIGLLLILFSVLQNIIAFSSSFDKFIILPLVLLQRYLLSLFNSNFKDASFYTQFSKFSCLFQVYLTSNGRTYLGGLAQLLIIETELHIFYDQILFLFYNSNNLCSFSDSILLNKDKN